MSYEPKPNEATLWENKFKTTDAHPSKKGQLLITRSLLLELSEQQGKGGDFTVDVSAWERVTKTGKAIINIKIEKPFKFGEQPTTPKPTETPNQKAERYLSKLKLSIASIENYPQFEELYEKIHSPEVWEVFKVNTAIAQQASSILSAKKSELILATEPIDLSVILSAIDVEIQRLGLPAKQHCLARWDKSRSKLTPQELQVYLDELAIAEPIKPSDDFF